MDWHTVDHLYLAVCHHWQEVCRFQRQRTWDFTGRGGCHDFLQFAVAPEQKASIRILNGMLGVGISAARRSRLKPVCGLFPGPVGRFARQGDVVRRLVDSVR